LNGGGDAFAYHRFGSEIVSDFRVTGDWGSFTVARGGSRGGTLFICELAGLLYLVSGPSISSGIVAFSIVAFWGQYLAYKAFTFAFPAGARSRATLLLFLFPSNVFWTATIGKDAVIGFSICLAVYGFARLVRAPGIWAYLSMAVGLAGAYFVRPHIAAMLVMAFTAAYIFGRNVAGFFSVAVKIVSIPMLGYGCVWLFMHAQRFLNAETFSKALISADIVSRNTNVGHSAIGASNPFSRMITAPFLLFRPFPWEIHSLQTALACAEALLLLLLFWVFRAQLKAAVRRWRSDAFLLFIFLYTIEFSLIVAGTFSNIGIIARQRTMILPFVFILLCLSRRLPSAPLEPLTR
jgi:hypothetical protein